MSAEALAEVDRWLAPYRLFWAARLVDLKACVEGDSQRGQNDDGGT